MKPSSLSLIFPVLLSIAVPLQAQTNAELKAHPAYLDIDAALDFKTIEPTVDVNLPRFLLNSALSEFDGSETDPFAAFGINLKELTQDVKLIRVVVIEPDEDMQPAVAKGVKRLREVLDAQWTSIVSVPEENVFIYARGDESGENVAGLALVVAEEGETVIGNLVGSVPIGKIASIAAKMGTDKMPKELLQALGGAFQGQAGRPGFESAHDAGHAEAASDGKDASEDTIENTAEDTNR